MSTVPQTRIIRNKVNTVRHTDEEYRRVRLAVNILNRNGADISINRFSREAIHAAAESVHEAYARDQASAPVAPVPPFKTVG